MAAGLGAGILGMLMWSYGFRIRVPEWMWRVAAIKLTFAAAVGLITVGALALRHLRRAERASGPTAELTPNEQARALGAAPPAVPWHERSREPQRITTPPDPHTP